MDGIAVNWNQDSPWNNMCPEDQDGPGGNVYAGCVAISMVQVMYYWGHPTSGSGYSSYFHSMYGPISVNFSEYTYDFSNMEDENATRACAAT